MDQEEVVMVGRRERGRKRAGKHGKEKQGEKEKQR